MKIVKMCVLLLTACLLLNIFLICSYAESGLKGSGQEEDPYRIETCDDLYLFSQLVNEGNRFEGQYVLQVADIDLDWREWNTIGSFGSGNYFYGIYDGGGHTITGLNVKTGGNNALFGILGGVVMNLGIESGSVSGACLGGITSHAADESAMILNCYSKAKVEGARTGGIADNFIGTISNCWSYCELTGGPENSGGIIAYRAGCIAHCFCVSQVETPPLDYMGCKVVSFDNFDGQYYTDFLNRGIMEASVASDFDCSRFVTWELREDGMPAFTEDRMDFEFKHIPMFLWARRSVLVVWGIVIGSVMVLLFCVRFPKKKI